MANDFIDVKKEVAEVEREGELDKHEKLRTFEIEDLFD